MKCRGRHEGSRGAGRLRLGKQTLCQLSYSRSGGWGRSPCGENLPLEPGDGRAGGAGKAQGDLTPDIVVLIVALQTGIIGAALYGLTFAAMILWAARGPTQGRALVLAMLGIFVISSVLSSSPDAPVFATTIWILILAVSAIPTETARSRPVSDHPRAG